MFLKFCYINKMFQILYESGVFVFVFLNFFLLDRGVSHCYGYFYAHVC